MRNIKLLLQKHNLKIREIKLEEFGIYRLQGLDPGEYQEVEFD